jgi:hypothetical protein
VSKDHSPEGFSTRSITSQLKQLGQRLGIKVCVLRQVLASGAVAPKSELELSPELTEEEQSLFALGAVLHQHGFQGPAVKTILKKAVPQLGNGRSHVTVDFHGAFPLQIRIPLDHLQKRLLKS